MARSILTHQCQPVTYPDTAYSMYKQCNLYAVILYSAFEIFERQCAGMYLSLILNTTPLSSSLEQSFGLFYIGKGHSDQPPKSDPGG